MQRYYGENNHLPHRRFQVLILLEPMDTFRPYRHPSYPPCIERIPQTYQLLVGGTRDFPLQNQGFWTSTREFYREAYHRLANPSDRQDFIFFSTFYFAKLIFKIDLS